MKQYVPENEQNNENQEYLSIKLAILGSVITAIGDTISVISGLKGLEEAINADAQQQQYKKEQEVKINDLQQQIDDLTSELEKSQSTDNGKSI